jgi:hypothetical protein
MKYRTVDNVQKSIIVLIHHHHKLLQLTYITAWKKKLIWKSCEYLFPGQPSVVYHIMITLSVKQLSSNETVMDIDHRF